MSAFHALPWRRVEEEEEEGRAAPLQALSAARQAAAAAAVEARNAAFDRLLVQEEEVLDTQAEARAFEERALDEREEMEQREAQELGDARAAAEAEARALDVTVRDARAAAVAAAAAAPAPPPAPALAAAATAARRITGSRDTGAATGTAIGTAAATLAGGTRADGGRGNGGSGGRGEGGNDNDSGRGGVVGGGEPRARPGLLLPLPPSPGGVVQLSAAAARELYQDTLARQALAREGLELRAITAGEVATTAALFACAIRTHNRVVVLTGGPRQGESGRLERLRALGEAAERVAEESEGEAEEEQQRRRRQRPTPLAAAGLDGAPGGQPLALQQGAATRDRAAEGSDRDTVRGGGGGGQGQGGRGAGGRGEGGRESGGVQTPRVGGGNAAGALGGGGNAARARGGGGGGGQAAAAGAPPRTRVIDPGLERCAAAACGKLGIDRVGNALATFAEGLADGTVVHIVRGRQAMIEGMMESVGESGDIAVGHWGRLMRHHRREISNDAALAALADRVTSAQRHVVELSVLLGEGRPRPQYTFLALALDRRGPPVVPLAALQGAARGRAWVAALNEASDAVCEALFGPDAWGHVQGGTSSAERLLGQLSLGGLGKALQEQIERGVSLSSLVSLGNAMQERARARADDPASLVPFLEVLEQFLIAALEMFDAEEEHERG